MKNIDFCPHGYNPNACKHCTKPQKDACRAHARYDPECSECAELIFPQLIAIFQEAVVASGKKVKQKPSDEQFYQWLSNYGPQVTREGIRKGAKGFLKKQDVITWDDAVYMTNYIGFVINAVSTYVEKYKPTVDFSNCDIDDEVKPTKHAYRIDASHPAIGTVIIVLTADDAKDAFSKFKQIVSNPRQWNILSNEEEK